MPICNLYAKMPLRTSTTETPAKLEVVPLPKFNYTFHILDKQRRIAVQYTDKISMTTPLNYANLPEPIRSTYISDEVLTFYKAHNGTESTAAADGRKMYKLKNGDVITAAPIPSDINTQGETPIDIWMTYTTNNLSDKDLHLRGVRAFGMKVSNKFASADGSYELKKTDAEVLADRKYWWHVLGEDPYAMQTQNIGVATNKYFKLDVSTTPPTESMGDATATESFFVLLNSEETSPDVLSISLIPTSESKIYTSTAITDTPSGNTAGLPPTVRGVQLTTKRVTTTYWLIDSRNRLLLKKTVWSSEPSLPSDIRSPFLTDSQYHYYDVTQKTETVTEGVTIYGHTSTELKSVVDATTENIYVFYDPCTSLTFSSGPNEGRTQMYLLRFLNGQMFNQEDGKDGFGRDTDAGCIPIQQRCCQSLYLWSGAF